ncbi:hypothetical protein A2U01_0073992, partial [Trifolium medium]|nr:hypothetical protein [Trifolium medium]
MAVSSHFDVHQHSWEMEFCQNSDFCAPESALER